MQPGKACISCHESQAGYPVLGVGGTVYPTLREPDGCYGVNGGMSVVIIDKNGVETSIPVGPTGNFALETSETPNFAMPIRAKVVKGSAEREMMTEQTSLDCNGCHTEQGKSGAPGRIMAP